ncbi:hypothetical protein [Bacillus bombysepticus]|uniref:hypothetical protein n=1 Tax=Bacillus bombysepticus TaxID=658666 RepID=UPI00301A53C5
MLLNLQKRFIFGLVTASTLLLSNVAHADKSAIQTFELKVTQPELVVTISDPGLTATTELPRNDVSPLAFSKNITINNGGNVDFDVKVKLGTPPTGIKFGPYKAEPGFMRVEVGSQPSQKNISDLPNQEVFLQKIDAGKSQTALHSFTLAPGTQVGTYPIKIEYLVTLTTA